MSEPIPVPLTPPDVTAAALLGELVAALYADPLTAVMAGRPTIGRPYYGLHDGALSISFYSIDDGAQVLAAARAFFGGDVTIETTSRDTETHTLTTMWGGVPLTVSVPIDREDEVASLRKQVAELEAAEAYRQAQLDEQRHQVADPAVPASAVTGVVTV